MCCEHGEGQSRDRDDGVAAGEEGRDGELDGGGEEVFVALGEEGLYEQLGAKVMLLVLFLLFKLDWEVETIPVRCYAVGQAEALPPGRAWARSHQP